MTLEELAEKYREAVLWRRKCEDHKEKAWEDAAARRIVDPVHNYLRFDYLEARARYLEARDVLWAALGVEKKARIALSKHILGDQ